MKDSIQQDELTNIARVLRESEARQRFLVQLGDTLRPLSDPLEVQDAAMRALGEHLGVTRALYFEIGPDGDRIVSSQGYSIDPIAMPEHLRISAFGDPFVRGYQERRTVTSRDIRVDPRFDDTARAAFEAIGSRAAAGVPLVKNGRLVVVLGLTDPEPRDWTEDDLRLLEDVAERTWEAVERARAEREGEAVRLELLRQLNFRDATLSAFGDYVYVWDLEGRFLYANPALERLWGLSRDQWYGKTDADIGNSPDHVELFERQRRQAAETRRPVAGETFYRPPGTGNGIWLDYILSPVFGPDGEVERIAGITRDATERKQAEQALRTSEEKYRTLFESMDEGFCVVEMIYAEDGRAVDYRFLEVNPAFEAQTDLRDAAGKTIREFVPDHEEHWFEIYGGVARTGESVRFEQRAAGLNRWYDVYAYRVGDPADHRVGVLFNDISERKRAEASLREDDRRKDEFLATLAHELRNPLAPIRTGLEVMKLAGSSPAVVSRTRRAMERQVEQMTRLIDDLLDVSRITHGRLELQIQPTVLTDVIESAVEATSPIIDGAGHDLSVTLPDEPIEMDADPNRLAQVLANLLSNAAKYTPRGGQIGLSASREQDELVIAVTDTGIGIPEDKREEIFEMFNQMDRRAAPGETGLGIGLTLVKSLVELHEGTVAVTSGGPNRGSEFSVRLPLRSRSSIARAPRAEAANGHDRTVWRVLVVDDNRDAADGMSTLLEMLGHTTHIAYDGFRALELTAEHLPDVIFLDLGMPKMDGWETARRIRDAPWGKDLVLVALTGWGQEKDRERTAAAGFNYHLVKPAGMATVEQLLDGLGH